MFEIIGAAGIAISMLAYLPQVVHLAREHPNKPGKVTVAGKPGADVPKGTAANILRQAGLRRSSR